MTNAVNIAQSGSNNVTMRNRIINGAMVIDQRNAGASVNPTDGQFITDRWAVARSQASKLTAQQNAGSVTPPAGFSNYLGITSSSAYSIGASDYFFIFQKIEGFNFADMAWGTANASSVTLSFRVYSSLTGTFGGSIQNSAQSRAYPFTFTVSSANTWTSVSITVAGDTSGTWIGATNGTGAIINFGLGVGSTYSASAGSWATGQYISATGATSVVGTSGATFYITGVQLEAGTTASPFEYRQYGTELTLCQRYFWVQSASNWSDSYCRFENVMGYSSSAGNFIAIFPVSMRASPTFYSSGASSYNLWNGTFYTVSGISISSYPTSGALRCDLTVTASVTQGNMYHLLANTNNTAYYGFSSEL